MRAVLAVLTVICSLLNSLVIAHSANLQRRARIDKATLYAMAHNRASVCGFQFDDGYLNQYTVGLPILESWGVTGSFGVITSKLELPGFMDYDMVWEMKQLGHHFQDHTYTHNAQFWGDTTRGDGWVAEIDSSQAIFQRIGFTERMRAWNQPGGTGSGGEFTSALRDTLKAHRYLYAAGRVGLSTEQVKNMHYGSIDDPFSWGTWCPAWWCNAPPATRTKYTETAAVIRYYADAMAVGGFPILCFHLVDPDAAFGLDSLCSWLAENNITVLGMDDLVALAELDRSYLYGMNLAASLRVDRNNDGRPDGFDEWYYIDMDGNANNGAGTTVYGVPPGKLVVSATIRAPLQTEPTDPFNTSYWVTTIDPATWEYTISPEISRSHTLIRGQTLTLSDTLEINDRVDRVRIMVQRIWPNPFVIEALSAIPIPDDPTGVENRPPRADLAISVLPNPVDDASIIAFHLEKETPISVAVYDVRGRLVERLADSQLLVGDVRLQWRSDSAAAGIYFVRVTAETVAGAKKIVLVK